MSQFSSESNLYKEFDKLNENSSLVWSDIERAISSPSYHTRSVAGRKLEIPDKALKVAHRLFHNLLSPNVDSFTGVHAVKEAVNADLREHSHFIRTDIYKCFPSIKQEVATKQLSQKINTLPTDKETRDFLLKTLPTIFYKGQLSTGSPASPIILQQLLEHLPKKFKGSSIYRYVDDILILGTKDSCTQSLDLVHTYLQPKGLRLNQEKTVSGEIKDSFTFLGYTFGSKSKGVEFPVTVQDFFPAKNWNSDFALSFDPSAPSYSNESGKTTYRADSLIELVNKGSIEALTVLCCARANPKLQNYCDTMQALIDPACIKPLHSKLYKGYLSNVSRPRKEGGKVVPHEADRILIGLTLDVYLQKNSSLPKSYKALTKDQELLAEAFNDASSGSGNYHKHIKKLFKEEYKLRTAKPLLKPNQEVLDNLSTSDNIFQDLLNKTFVHSTGLELEI